MKKTSILKVKRVTSGILALVMTASLTSVMPAAADTPIEPASRTYSGDGYEVCYDVTGGWADNRNVQVTLTNTGDEPIQNWALKYDVHGEIVNIWNGTIVASGDDWSIIKNTGYNYEIQPRSSASFGYIVQGSDIDIPASIELCSKRVESDADDYNVSLNVESEWDTGFTGNVKIENTGDAPLEAWRLSFDANFDLEDVWNASVISSEDNHYTVSNSYATASIGTGETVTFGIRGTKKAGKSPELSNISMTEISISADFTDNTKPDDSSSESDSSSEADSSSETDSSSEADSSSVTDSTPDESSSLETDSKPDDSKPDDEMGDISVVAYGAYNANESAIDIEWYTETEGNYEVLESPDNETYTSVIEESDFMSYRYHINEDFDTKYFKVKVTNGKKSAESLPFVVKKTEEGYSVDFIDTDSDGLADLYEDILGTDKTKPDTDDDGLTDYQEVYLTGTDPLVYDSVTSGISDAEADSDNDGLSNIKELEVGIDPSSDDTDGDKLRDGDEVNKYGTDPLIVDTDEDGLSDYEEVSLNIDPLNGSSDGKTSDKDKKFVQTVGEESDAFAAINTEDNPFKVSMKISASGLACENLDSEKSGYANAIQSDAVLGIVPEFTYTEGLSVDDVEIYFNIDEKYISNTNGKYSAVSDEFEGIKRLNVFKYFDDIDMLLPIETTYDEKNHTVSTHVDELGTYCLLDMEIWLEMLEIEPSKFGTTILSGNNIGMLGGYAIPKAVLSTAALSKDKIKSEPLDVFLFTFAHNTEDKKTDIENIKLISKELFALYPNQLRVYIVIYTGSIIPINLSTNKMYATKYEEIENLLENESNRFPLCVIDSQLEKTINNFFDNTFDNRDAISSDIIRTNSDKYFFFVESTVHNTTRLSTIAERINIKNIKASVISKTNTHKSLADLTNGMYTDDVLSYYDEIIEFIKESHGYSSYKVFSAQGWKQINLEAPITIKYENEYNALEKAVSKENYRKKIYNRYADTDNDGLLDLEEVSYFLNNYRAIYWDDKTGEALLPTLDYCLTLIGSSYTEDPLGRFGYAFDNWDVRILPLKSDPNLKDSDFDGELDIEDKTPLSYLRYGNFIYYLNKLQMIADEEVKIFDFNLDYTTNKQMWLIASFIRSFEDDYDNDNWNMTGGRINYEFNTKIEKDYPEIYNYFLQHRELGTNDSVFDLYHFGATLSALTFNTNFDDGYSNFTKLGAQFMPEIAIDSLAGWAGDLQSLSQDFYEECKLLGTSVYYYKYYDFYNATLLALSGEKKSHFSIGDQNADIDALLIYNECKKKNRTLYDVAKKYYSSDVFNKYSRFYDSLNEYWICNSIHYSEFNQHIEANVNYFLSDYYLEFIKWPILNKTVNGKTEYYEITQEMRKGLREAFIDYIKEKANIV